VVPHGQWLQAASCEAVRTSVGRLRVAHAHSGMNIASCVGLLAAKPPEVKATKVGGKLKVTDYMPVPFQAVSASSKLNAANNWPAASS
jgi:hypothetical protein